MTRKVLIYTDSRGQHIPTGARPHDLFADRIRALADVDAEIVLCPMKWTTTIDFLEYMATRDWQSYDHLILYTGIVDWSPRPQMSAISDLYNNQAPENLTNTNLNTADYGQKVVNNKKQLFDDIFGEKLAQEHLDHAFDTEFEGKPTVNMYSLEMARKSLLPKLQEIENLIFINSNRFVPGWKGDHKRGRPDNISITEKYSEMFLEVLGEKQVIDLLTWDRSEVQRFTCDNMHLTKQGSDWIFDQLIKKMSALGPSKKRPLSGQVSVNLDRSHQADQLSKLSSAMSDGQNIGAFFDTFQRSAQFLLDEREVDPNQFADDRYLGAFSTLYSDQEVGQIASFSQSPLDGVEIANVELKLFESTKTRNEYLVSKKAVYDWRYSNEFQAVRPISTKFFPYNYLSAYAYSAEISERDISEKTVVFIYCIKNRRVRTDISLKSLIAAHQRYQEQGGGALRVRVLIVEDMSSDLYDIGHLEGTVEIEHILVDTGIGWTRSGLLNVGLREATGDLAAFVDADFLFHEKFFNSLENVLNQTNWRRHVFAVNLIETEAHTKNDTVYSTGSPYSYMWMAPLDVAIDVNGFDEGYTGHGSEDRDFELKLTKLGGLIVTDTITVDPDCIVFHLSHNSRDGIDNHQANRARYLGRLAETDLSKLRQDEWGEAKIIQKRQNFEARRLNHSHMNGAFSKSKTARGTCYMVISCIPYEQRRHILREWYSQVSDPQDKVVFVVGGAEATFLDENTSTLHLEAGDFYEDLPEKVLKAFLYMEEHFDFKHVVKVDDDVIINFGVLRYLLHEMDAPYIGKMIPSRRGAKPSETWHFDKVTERSRHYQRPFSFEGGPSNWACGGMYVLRRDGLELLATNANGVDTQEFLYEDHMIGSLLHKSGIEALFVEEVAGLESFRFIETDLRNLMDDDLKKFKNEKVIQNIAGVHCGPFPPYYKLSQERSLEILRECIRTLKRLPLQADLPSYAN